MMNSETCVFGPLTIEVLVLEHLENQIRYEAKIRLGDEEPFVSRFPSAAGEDLETVAKNILCDLKDACSTSEEMQRSIEGLVVGRAEEGVMKQMHAFWAWASQRRDAIQKAVEAGGLAPARKA